MAVRRVSQKNVADAAGVHVTTVSLALKNSPRLPIETREKIQRIARELGYQPDPMLSALTIYRRKVHQPYFQGTLAWLDNLKGDSQPPAKARYRDYWDGAVERCSELGYQIEEFSTDEMSLSRISKILKARGISCILLPPQPRHLSHIKFDWENFCALSFGFSLAFPRLHLVTNAQYRSARQAVRTIRSYGYRRIGFTTLRVIELRTDQNFSSGYLAEHRLGRREPLPIFEFDDAQKSVRRTFLRDFAKWLRTCKPDAIISLDHEVANALKILEIEPSKCAYASLHLDSAESGVAGICQNDKLVGRAAVDYIVDMYNRNERGVPAVPYRVLVEGTWVDGPTLPRRVSPAVPVAPVL
ncbi:LacI family transcriptional regulator [Spartobacteria bacterium LR76]|nr:LacI family transcriptional regulator [Spartobacteria bacterium LR76]